MKYGLHCLRLFSLAYFLGPNGLQQSARLARTDGDEWIVDDGAVIAFTQPIQG